MLTVTNDCTVLQMFFNFLSNFARHWRENCRPVITRGFFLTVLGRGDICQSPDNSDLLRFPRQLKNKWGLCCEDFSQELSGIMYSVWVLLIQRTLIKFSRSRAGLSGQLGDGTLEIWAFSAWGREAWQQPSSIYKGVIEKVDRLCTWEQRERMTDSSHKLE